MKRKTRMLTLAVFLVTAAAIAALLVLPRGAYSGGARAFKKLRVTATRYDAPQEIDFSGLRAFRAGEEPRVALGEADVVLGALSGDFNGDGAEEQVIAYRSFGADGKQEGINVTFVAYNEADGGYTRILSAPVPVAAPGTLALYSEDLIGDRRGCVIVSGMNEKDEKTMSVYRWTGGEGAYAVRPIAAVVSDGSISIREAERPLAYGQGLTRGPAYAIEVRAHDPDSPHGLDRIETIWTYDADRGMYVKGAPVRIAGARVESRTLRDVLGGNAASFERFVSGLWYHVSAGGTVDSEQYVYFDTENREIIFYGDNTQQVYGWRASRATRFGIYVSSQNISVPTMNRIVDIELESADSIRVRVFEDVRMRIQVSAPWDGTYRKAAAGAREPPPAVSAFIAGAYTCALGRLRFFPGGVFELRQDGMRQEGGYAFFALDGAEILELVPRRADGSRAPGGEAPARRKPRAAGGGEAAPGGLTKRETYRVERPEGAPARLYRVRLGTRGIQEYHEAPLVLTPAD